METPLESASEHAENRQEEESTTGLGVLPDDV
jgi:hypothetical protein